MLLWNCTKDRLTAIALRRRAVQGIKPMEFMDER